MLVSSLVAGLANSISKLSVASRENQCQGICWWSIGLGFAFSVLSFIFLYFYFIFLFYFFFFFFFYFGHLGDFPPVILHFPPVILHRKLSLEVAHQAFL